MNCLVIPPSPNWYETSILACAPDNTLVYGARNDIVVVYNSQRDQPAEVKIIPKAHSQKITSVNLNKNWGNPNKLLVTVSEDKLVKLWNIETLEKKLSHSIHKVHSKVIGGTFAGDERVISVSEEGAIVVWNLGSNQPNLLKDIFGFKVTVTCISTCPHANWLTAFGLKNGLVIVADLRKQGKVLYKLRGHDKSVMSLSWCPATVNIFPKDPHNYVGMKKVISDENSAAQVSATHKVADNTNDEGPNKENAVVSDEISLCQTSSKYKHKKNLWTNLKHADDDELPEDYKEKEKTHPLLKVYDSEDDDFLMECQKLKNQILGTDTSNTSSDEVKTEAKDYRPILKAKKHKKLRSPARSGELQDEAGEKSLENVGTITDVVAKDGDGFIENCEDVGNEEKDNSMGESIEENIAVTERLNEGGGDLNREEVDNIKTGENKLQEASQNSEVTSEEGQNEVVNNANKQTEAFASEEELKSLEKTADQMDGSVEVSSSDVKREIPVNVPVEEEPRKEFLLASSAKEGHIYIWRAGTDGRMQTFLTVSNKNNRRSSKANADKIWITLCWVSPTSLLSSSKSGELLQWILPKPKDKSKHYRIIHNDHGSLLFSIAAPTVLLNESNWLDVDEKRLNVWTVGQDRLLLNTTLSCERTNLNCYPTVGVVECFALSPLDPSRLAIGTGEGIIKIWDLSRPHTRNIVMTNFYQKIQSKVVTLAWHPTNEVQLAYGTMEGRIGYLDISNKSKSPTLLPNFFKSQIHKIEWGPLNSDTEDLVLFAVAEGKLIAFNNKKSEKDPQEVDVPDNTFVYTFAWKPDYKTMLVSSKAGALIVYSSDLKILSTHYLQRKLQTILWHPSANQSDRNATKYCDWFASVSNSRDLVVYDFGVETDNNEEKIVAKYRATDTINCLAWNPFEENQLVIAVDNGIVQIWDAVANAVLTTYVNPNFESVSAVTWSPMDSDYVISAGKDHTIRVWKISDCPVMSNEDILNLKKKCFKDASDDPTALAPKLEKPQEEQPKVKKNNKNNLLPNFYNPKSTTQVVADLRKLLSWKDDPNVSIESQIDDTEDGTILNIFGSRADMLKIIQANESSHKMRGKYNLNNTLSLFKGDISTAVKEAIEEKRVTPWVITMAPMISPKLWKTACEVYAQQLSEQSDSDPLEIVTYYLACHKIDEAINALCEGAMFREALALAKCRLPENDPLITKVIEKWASYSLIVGNFETAAQCNIFLGKYEEAASVLFRRSDVDILEFAAELAEKSGNEELHKAVLFRYNTFKTENEANKVNGELPSKVEVMLEKEQLEKYDEGKECDNVGGKEVRNGEIMSSSLDNGGLQASFVQDESIEGREIRRSSSLGDNFRIPDNDTTDGVKLIGEEDENATNGLLTTNEVKKLLGDIKFVGVDTTLDQASLDTSKNDTEKSF